ncbi:MAG: nitronate monooxygenase [Proteobacteria bacterium]|nr:nitronate monooxygenase [Pseudomonadota bacterium]
MKTTKLAAEFVKRLNIQLPIIQAPMAGGMTPPKLVAAVCDAGGLGSLPLGYLTREQAEANIRATKALTSKPFSVNVFIPNHNARIDAKKTAFMNSFLKKFRDELKLPLEEKELSFEETSAEELVELTIQEKIPAMSFTFGILNPSMIQRLKEENIFVIGTATTVQEGLALEKAGCDAVVAQGYEAGGHRGTFLSSHEAAKIGTMVLVPQLASHLKIPVIAAGGIMNGSSVVAALDLGASAIQMGTAFLTCHESGASELYKQKVLNSTEESTVITSAFTGKPVRAIRNYFLEELEKIPTDQIPDYPIQHVLTQPIRREAVRQQNGRIASFWAGQGTRLNREMSVLTLMDEIKKEVEACAQRFELKK